MQEETMSFLSSYVMSPLSWAAKKYGARRVAGFISAISLHGFPLVLWLNIYVLLGEGFFSLPFPLNEGAIILTLISILLFAFVGWLASYVPQKVLIKRIEEASQKGEGLEPLARGFLNLFVMRGFSFRSRLARILGCLSPILNVVFSYAFVVSIIASRTWLLATLTSLVEPISQSVSLPQIASNYFAIVLLFMLVFSFPSFNSTYLESWRFFMAHHIKPPIELLVSLPIPYISIGNTCSVLVSNIATAIPSGILVLRPLVISSDLPKIVARSFQNAQGKECRVTTFTHTIQNIAEVESSRELSIKYFGVLAGSLRLKDARPPDAMKMVAEIRPILYLGFVDKQCAFVGMVGYNATQKARTGIFYFSSHYVQGEFEAIMEKDREKARSV